MNDTDTNDPAETDLTESERIDLARLRAACKDARETASKLGVNRETLWRLLAREPVRKGTVAFVRAKLEKLKIGS